MAWSRILDDEEALCVINAHANDERGGDIVVAAELNPPGSFMTVVLNTAQAAGLPSFSGSHPIGSTISVRRKPDGTAYVEVRRAQPSEVLVLTNRP